MWIGNRADTTQSDYLIELLAGSSVLAEDNNTLLPDEGEFLQSTVTFFAEASDSRLGELLMVRFRADGVQVNFDDVRLSATVIPEPGAGLLMAMIPLAILSRRRR